MDDELYEKLQRIDCAPERRSGGALAWTAHSAIHAIAVLAACYEQEYGWALQTEPTASSPTIDDVRRVMKTLRLLDLGHTLSAEQLRNVNSSSVRRRLNIAVSSLIEKVEARRGSEGLRQHRKTSSKPLLRRGTNSNPTQLQTNPTSHSDRPTSAKNNPNDHRRKIAPAKKAPVPTVRQQRRIHPAASKPKPRPIPTETSQEQALPVQPAEQAEEPVKQLAVSASQDDSVDVETTPEPIPSSACVCTNGDDEKIVAEDKPTTPVAACFSTVATTAIDVGAMLTTETTTDKPMIVGSIEAVEVSPVENVAAITTPKSEKPPVAVEPEVGVGEELERDNRLELEWDRTCPTSDRDFVQKGMNRRHFDGNGTVSATSLSRRLEQAQTETSLRTRIRLLRQFSESDRMPYRSSPNIEVASELHEVAVERNLFKAKYEEAQNRIAAITAAITTDS